MHDISACTPTFHENESKLPGADKVAGAPRVRGRADEDKVLRELDGRRGDIATAPCSVAAKHREGGRGDKGGAAYSQRKAGCGGQRRTTQKPLQREGRGGLRRRVCSFEECQSRARGERERNRNLSGAAVRNTSW